LRHSNHARHAPPEDGHQGEQYAWAHFPHLGSPDLGRKYSLSVTAARQAWRACSRGSAVFLAVLAANAVAILLAATIAYRALGRGRAGLGLASACGGQTWPYRPLLDASSQRTTVLCSAAAGGCRYDPRQR
jgi:hypothetical protein